MTLVLLINTTQDYSNFLITVFSIVFTMISILLSCFEYFLSSKFVSLTSIIISFCIESHEIATMSHPKFESRMVFRRYKVIGSLAKLLKVRYEQVERLKPTKLSNGARFLFTIAIDVSQYDNVKQLMQQSVYDGTLAKVRIQHHVNAA